MISVNNQKGLNLVSDWKEEKEKNQKKSASEQTRLLLRTWRVTLYVVKFKDSFKFLNFIFGFYE